MQVSNIPSDLLYNEQNITGTAQTQAEESEKLTTPVSSTEDSSIADSGAATTVRNYDDVVYISSQTVNATQSLEDANNEQYSHVHHEALHAYIYGNQRAANDETAETSAQTAAAEADDKISGALMSGREATGTTEETTTETSAAAEDTDEAEKTSDDDGEDTNNNGELSEEEEEKVQDMQQREQEVIAHENAHRAAGGSLASAPSYDYEQGPDGRSYINSGEVSIDISKESDPEDTIDKMEQVKAAALAPAEPSSADRSAAAEATSIAAEARNELASEAIEPPETATGDESEEEEEDEASGAAATENLINSTTAAPSAQANNVQSLV